ncbi:hypothetical protein QYF36_009242 [Acer negundo]|nr:hypothetical protein QYF36_009242 [Acer negundo]
MAHYILYLSLLLNPAPLLQSSHAVDYVVTNNTENTVGARFNNEIGEACSKQTLSSTIAFIWRIFQQTNTANWKNMQKVSLFNDNMDGVTYTINGEIHNCNGQALGGLIEGIADYMPSHWVKAGQGNRWDQGYDITARFLDYCNSLRNGFVAELNKKMKDGCNDSYFVDLLGENVLRPLENLKEL